MQYCIFNYSHHDVPLILRTYLSHMQKFVCFEQHFPASSMPSALPAQATTVPLFFCELNFFRFHMKVRDHKHLSFCILTFFHLA